MVRKTKEKEVRGVVVVGDVVVGHGEARGDEGGPRTQVRTTLSVIEMPDLHYSLPNFHVPFHIELSQCGRSRT